ncbi:MAG: hypothetical protein Q6351_006300 [Candidatus Njordarchaeum guaymaensis]
MQTAINMLVAHTITRIVKDEYQNQKNLLRPERKRRWSKKTTWDKIRKRASRLFYRNIGELALFREILSQVREFAKINGPPYIHGSRGPSFRYDPIIVAALLIWSSCLNLGNQRLALKAKELSIDARRSKKPHSTVPYKSQLRNVLSRWEFPNWLNDFMSWQAFEYAKRFLQLFGERELVLDGTDMQTNRLKKTISAGKATLVKKTLPVRFLYNVNLDMYVHVEQTTSHNAKEFIGKLSQDDILLMDSEFFARENCELTLVKGIDIQVKSTRNERRGPALRLCRARLRKRKYRRRKNGERGAKIYDENVMLYADPVRQRVKIRLMAVGYNVKRLIKLSIKYESMIKLVMWLT